VNQVTAARKSPAGARSCRRRSGTGPAGALDATDLPAKWRQPLAALAEPAYDSGESVEGVTLVNQIDLEGRRAVVTGGGQGIGRAIAERLLASGAAIALWDRDQATLEATRAELSARGQVHAVTADVTDLEGVEAARAATNEALGGIDILVNNAGIAGPIHMLWEYPVEAWREVIEIDLNAVFYCCRAVVPQMIEQNYGRIVNVASIAGKEGNPSASAYAAAKSGVIALTKALGKELATYDIAVNCITPAAARTRIFDQITQEFVDFMLTKIPRGRFVKVEEIAAMVAWLASAENSFTTGAVFDLSGGRATY
jgi:2-dehydro-3-deoxy-L-rhamnonate dehydrogenase (NAD+)